MRTHQLKDILLHQPLFAILFLERKALTKQIWSTCSLKVAARPKCLAYGPGLSYISFVYLTLYATT